MKILRSFKGFNIINISGDLATLMFSFLCGLVIMYVLTEFKDNCWITNNCKQHKNELIIKLVRQTARWATAATQDDNPLIAVLHANYGTGYLWALKDIANKNEIETAANIDLVKFQNNVIQIQDATTKRLAKVCPDFAKTDNIYLAKIAGEA
tara:strand:+ start:298 stop:753 length:456 start_codon:yes stop_codon:yes gene_type:complete